MERPAILYHGSKIRTGVLRPHQAGGLPEERGAEFGVYAYPTFDMARFFALPIEPAPNGNLSVHFDEVTGRITIRAGTLARESWGYVYKVSSASFVPLDTHQWLSTEEVVPLEVTQVYAEDLWDRITFLGSARRALLEADGQGAEPAGQEG
ncbi:MAG: hypothetical protein ACYC4R_04520 [Anaerolineae bacterium]